MADEKTLVAWVKAEGKGGPVVEIGCGPSRQLTDIAAVQADAEALPFAPGSLGGAIANRLLANLAPAMVPTALRELHQAMAPEAPAYLAAVGEEQRLRDVCEGAGLTVDGCESAESTTGWPRLDLRLRRRHSLADTVGADMRLLICGLNPSPASAEAGIGFARPSNRFWPAALAAGLVTRDRDPGHALRAHGVGMTDLVKRPTRQAAELDADEYRTGLARVERLVEWLQPSAICFVGLAGWRAAVDRRAMAGLQTQRFGGRPVYLMPSTSGLNAHARLDHLTAHLREASAIADRADGDK